MKYIAHRRFKTTAICGDVNIPACTECEENNGTIQYNGKDVCSIFSENAHQYFARNNDGRGLERGKLTQAITKKLSHYDEDYQNRWDKIWDDPMCQPYRRPEHKDFWLWNHNFYNADIGVLRHIANLIGININK